MRDLILKLPTKEFILQRNQSLRALLEIIPSEHICEELLPGRKDFIFKSLGFELMLRNGKLKAISLNIASEAYSQCFEKSCSYLEEGFWLNPSPESFQFTLLEHGFLPRETKSNATHSMALEDLKYVYFKSPDKSRIGISWLN